MPVKPYLPSLVIGTWLLSLGFVLLTLTTPLEFTPLPLGNLPRLGLWGLVFPACQMLWQRTGVLRGLWRTLPWLLWGPLLVLQSGWFLLLLLSFEQRAMLEPTTSMFARPQVWRTKRVLFRRGLQVVAMQQIDPLELYPRSFRTALLTPVFPGLQWATRLTDNQLLDASWQVSDLADVQASPQIGRQLLQLSRDSTLHRLLRPSIQQAWRRHQEAVRYYPPVK
ncbi:hypothetical protein [Hymenobacter crusticola]|uniref:Uncharacterized protein n=1 Tax=Hymenobacter crusticola TaxID=1770526 RepID=A0A243W5A6_9BACT|nr:hypothetical protein [Hymenobacter crusticola]OUJ68580.1 hypothetical protein BXP70_27860 [Hymenobacter crusticola]